MEERRAPDGGYGWIIVLSSFLALFLSLGNAQSFGVMIDDLIDRFQSSRGDTSWVGSIEMAMGFFASVPGALIIPYLGTKRVAFLGSLLAALGSALSYLAENVYVLYVTFGLVSGCGCGLMLQANGLLVQLWFERKRALATGLMLTGSSVGTVAFVYLTRLLNKEYGWQGTFLIRGSILLNGAISSVLHRMPPHVSVQYSESQTNNTSNIASNPEKSIDEETDKQETGDINGFKRWIILFRNPIFVLFLVSTILGQTGAPIAFVHLPGKAKANGINENDTTSLLAVVALANIPGQLIWGFLADRMDKLMLLSVSSIICAAANVFVIFVETKALFFVYAAVVGFGFGGNQAMGLNTAVGLAPTQSFNEAMSSTASAIGIGFLIGSPIAGILFDATNNYDLSFSFTATVLLLSALLSIIGSAWSKCRS